MKNMNIKKSGRIVGVLFLLNFVAGIIIYQILQGPVLFSKEFIALGAEKSSNLIISILLSVINGTASIAIAMILLPIFKKYHAKLAMAYLVFCVVYFMAMMVDNFSVFSMMQFSQEHAQNVNENSDSVQVLGDLLYKRHWWTHYISLLTSCLPVFVLYYNLFLSKLIPRAISIFGLVAVTLMFIQTLASIFGHSISMMLMIPMGLIQLTLPLWLIIKSFNSNLSE